MKEKGLLILKIVGLTLSISGTIITAVAGDKSNKLELVKLTEKHFENMK